MRQKPHMIHFASAYNRLGGLILRQYMPVCEILANATVLQMTPQYSSSVISWHAGERLVYADTNLLLCYTYFEYIALYFLLSFGVFLFSLPVRCTLFMYLSVFWSFRGVFVVGCFMP